MKTRHNSSNRQQGAALVVALIMLIMVSLLAAGSFFLTTGEARGASSWSDRQRAMFSAEGALKEASTAIEAIADQTDVRLAVEAKGVGYYLRHEETIPDASDLDSWTNAYAIKATAADERADNGYYMVVYEGAAPKLDNQFVDHAGNTSKSSMRPRFTIYAKAGGIKDGTFVVLSTSKEF